MFREAFGAYSLSQTAIFERHKRFEAGREPVEDKYSGRLSNSKTIEDIEKIRELVHEGRRRTIHEPADTVGARYGVCQKIITNSFEHVRITPPIHP
jgi:hypothetical protein